MLGVSARRRARADVCDVRACGVLNQAEATAVMEMQKGILAPARVIFFLFDLHQRHSNPARLFLRSENRERLTAGE